MRQTYAEPRLRKEHRQLFGRAAQDHLHFVAPRTRVELTSRSCPTRLTQRHRASAPPGSPVRDKGRFYRKPVPRRERQSASAACPPALITKRPKLTPNKFQRLPSDWSSDSNCACSLRFLRKLFLNDQDLQLGQSIQLQLKDGFGLIVIELGSDLSASLWRRPSPRCDESSQGFRREHRRPWQPSSTWMRLFSSAS